MAVNFPTTLQDKFNASGFTQSFGETSVRSNVAVGPAKIRRRFTKSIESYGGSITMTFGEWQTLYDFYNTTLDGGSQPFLFTDPFSETLVEFRFVKAPSMRPIGSAGLEYSVTMSLERLP